MWDPKNVSRQYTIIIKAVRDNTKLEYYCLKHRYSSSNRFEAEEEVGEQTRHDWIFPFLFFCYVKEFTGSLFKILVSTSEISLGTTE